MILPRNGSPALDPDTPAPGFLTVRAAAVQSGETLAHVTAPGGNRTDWTAGAVDASVAWIVGRDLAARLADPEAWGAMEGPDGWEWRAWSPGPGLVLVHVRAVGAPIVALSAAVAIRRARDPEALAVWRRMRGLAASDWEAVAGDGSPIPEGLAVEDFPADPPARPWVVGALRPGIAESDRTAAGALWLGDFEKCAAWAYALWSRYADRRAAAR